ncbi:MAG: RNB domain-containing ribonuclease, partial [Candidatus Adiutrix sp.]|nr:RNB domain-containing ribonuclease [Candidatus Adiutrix sp.]
MIVEFLEGRDFMTAWVAQTTPRRLTALGRDGREMTISQNRILSSQEAPDPGGKAGRLELLRLTDARRRAMALTIDLAELWEVLEGEGRDFGYAALAALFFGRAPSTDEIAAMSRAVFADGLRFKFTPEGAVRHDAAEMEKLAAARRRAEEEERFTAEAAAWIAEAARGAVAPEPAEGADEVRRLLTGLALWGEEAEGRQAAKKILGRAGLPADSEGAVRALTALGEFAAHENLDLRRLDIPVVFSPETMEAAQALPGTRRPGADGRMDLTALATLTIDSNGARDLDDAVSIKSLAGGRWQVGIHITDVA